MNKKKTSFIILGLFVLGFAFGLALGAFNYGVYVNDLKNFGEHCSSQYRQCKLAFDEINPVMKYSGEFPFNQTMNLTEVLYNGNESN